MEGPLYCTCCYTYLHGMRVFLHDECDEMISSVSSGKRPALGSGTFLTTTVYLLALI